VIRVTLSGAAVGTGTTAALPPVSASFAAGAPTLLATEGGTRPTVLSLVASGRMKLDAGSVTAARLDADGHEHPLKPAELRRAVALIDTPLVAEHSDDVSVSSVVREELALARSHRRADRPAAYADRKPFGSLSAVERLGLLVDLALRRPDVEALVITSPERHGGEPARWWRLMRETASRGADGGVAVLVVTDHATVAHLQRLPHPEPVGDDALPLFSL
jgi:ABC-2 type transport system ATP-binding protein